MANDDTFNDLLNLRFDPIAFRSAGAVRFRSMRSLAEAAGLPEQRCRHIALGLMPSREERAKIAAALGVEESVLWKPVTQAA